LEKVYPILGPIIKCFRKKQDESQAPLIDSEN